MGHRSIWHQVMDTADAGTRRKLLFAEFKTTDELRKSLASNARIIAILQKENDGLREDLMEARSDERDTTNELVTIIEEVQANSEHWLDEVLRCHARLEIDCVYVWDLETHELTPKAVPMDERHDMPDAVYCRDVTIQCLKEEYAEAEDIIRNMLAGYEEAFARAVALVSLTEEKEN